MAAGAAAGADWEAAGNKPFSGTNPAYGAPVTYYLKDKGATKIEILDASGKVIRDLGPVPQEEGLKPDGRGICAIRVLTCGTRHRMDDGGGFRFSSYRSAGVAGQNIPFALTAGGKTLTQELEVKLDPTVPVEEGRAAHAVRY